MSSKLKILITGVAGFIGSNLAFKLLNEGHTILGIDLYDSYQYKGIPIHFTMDSYLAPLLIRERFSRLIQFPSFLYVKANVSTENDHIRNIIEFEPDVIVHLAAHSGVSLCELSPTKCIENNVMSLVKVMEHANRPVNKFIYASSSSVYGNTCNLFAGNTERDTLPNPLSTYALSKQMAEQAAEYLAKKHPQTVVTGLRLFSVYGPMGRPDMAPWKLSLNAFLNKHSYLTNNGNIIRDFTYIDDVVNAISRLISTDVKLPSIVNIGSGHPIALTELNRLIYSEHGSDLNPIEDDDNAIDARITHADNSLLFSILPNLPQFTSKAVGIKKFVEWHRNFLTKANVS